LLNAVSDNIHDIIFLLDKNGIFVFANLSLAKILGIQPSEIAGRSLANVLGADAAHKLENIQHNPGSTEDSPTIINLPIADTNCTYHLSSAVLAHGQYQNTTLYVLHDIGELKKAQEKRDQLARGIIGTLVKAVDLHDPYCVDHSSRTREVAMCIANELHLEKSRRDALEMAALLANIGKLFLPREILTKMEPLSDAENEMLKWHIDYAVDILKQLDFEGPVVKIISQKNEHLDGSGYPRGLQAADILTESRILAVANAFVAMASARAYREGRPINDVLGILLQQCEHHYDRHVVAALFHISENKADWRNWQIAAPPVNKH
ncbi:MAG: HD domain-containing protein, partial [Gammaproteobacteria bacterium]|nr:HD domain-containing protein [Gammaproteobacteria bacterium]